MRKERGEGGWLWLSIQGWKNVNNQGEKRAQHCCCKRLAAVHITHITSVLLYNKPYWLQDGSLTLIFFYIPSQLTDLVPQLMHDYQLMFILKFRLLAQSRTIWRYYCTAQQGQVPGFEKIVCSSLQIPSILNNWKTQTIHQPTIMSVSKGVVLSKCNFSFWHFCTFRQNQACCVPLFLVFILS